LQHLYLFYLFMVILRLCQNLRKTALNVQVGWLAYEMGRTWNVASWPKIQAWSRHLHRTAEVNQNNLLLQPLIRPKFDPVIFRKQTWNANVLHLCSD
jgi:hypothetical protein